MNRHRHELAAQRPLRRHISARLGDDGKGQVRGVTVTGGSSSASSVIASDTTARWPKSASSRHHGAEHGPAGFVGGDTGGPEAELRRAEALIVCPGTPSSVTAHDPLGCTSSSGWMTCTPNTPPMISAGAHHALAVGIDEQAERRACQVRVSSVPSGQLAHAVGDRDAPHDALHRVLADRGLDREADATVIAGSGIADVTDIARPGAQQLARAAIEQLPCCTAIRRRGLEQRATCGRPLCPGRRSTTPGSPSDVPV